MAGISASNIHHFTFQNPYLFDTLSSNYETSDTHEDEEKAAAEPMVARARKNFIVIVVLI